MDNWLLQQCRSSSLRRLAGWSLVAVMVLTFAALNLNHIKSLAAGNDSLGILDIFGAVVAVAVVALLFKVALPAWRCLQKPSSHPVIARVGRWGDPARLSTEIESEYRSPRLRYKSGWYLGDRYIIQARYLSINVLRFEDLLWTFKRVTKRSVNLIPVETTFEALLMCYGGTAVVKGSLNETDATLTFATKRAPWALVGYSKELETLFTTQTRDFCKTVEARKREIRAANADQRTSGT